MIKGIDLDKLLDNLQDTWLFVPTNGYVKSNGEIVCGNKVLSKVSEKFKMFPRILGMKVKEYGSVTMQVIDLPHQNSKIFSFPTRPNKLKYSEATCFVKKNSSGDKVPGWMAYPMLTLICNSMDNNYFQNPPEGIDVILIDPFWDECYETSFDRGYAQRLLRTQQAIVRFPEHVFVVRGGDKRVR